MHGLPKLRSCAMASNNIHIPPRGCPVHPSMEAATNAANEVVASTTTASPPWWRGSKSPGTAGARHLRAGHPTAAMAPPAVVQSPVFKHPAAAALACCVASSRIPGPAESRGPWIAFTLAAKMLDASLKTRLRRALRASFPYRIAAWWCLVSIRRVQRRTSTAATSTLAGSCYQHPSW